MNADRVPYPGMVRFRVPVEGHIPLALHFPVVASGVHAPLGWNPLVRGSTIVEPVLLQP